MPIFEAVFPIPARLRSEGTNPHSSENLALSAELRSLLAFEGCGRAERAALAAISKEKDPDLRRAALRHFASSQESKGRLALAAATYETLLAAGGDEIAQKRLAALHGGGDFGDRTEVLLRNLFQQALQPEMLGGLAAGGLVGQGLKAASLAHLLRGTPAFWTRGFGARALASSAGFLGEVPAVILVGEGIHELRGAETDWSSGALARDAVSLGLGLSLLKGSSALSGHLMSGWNLASPLGARWGASLLPGVTATAALYAAHRAESAWGLRPSTDAAAALADSVALFFQFQLSGRFLHAATGGAMARSLAELDARSRLSVEPPFSTGPRGGAELGFAGIPARRGQQQPFDMTGPLAYPVKKIPNEKVLMASWGENGGGREFLYRRLIQRLASRLGVSPQDSRLRDIADNYWATPFHRKAESARADYFELLTQTELKPSHFLEGREISAIDLMAGATVILRRAMEMNSFRTGMGSFYDFLTQVAFEETLAARRVPVWDALVHTLALQPSQASLENFFQAHELHHPFTRQSLSSGRASLDLTPWMKRLEEFPLSDMARWWLAEYLVSYSHGLLAAPFRNPTSNYFYMHEPASREPRPMIAEEVFATLQEMFRDPTRQALWREGLDQVVERARHSPVPMLYFDRFFKLRASGDLPEKIPELMQKNPYHFLEALQRGDRNLPLDETVYTAYVSDPVLAEKVRRFYHVLPELLHPRNSEVRLAQYRMKASNLLQEGKNNFGREEILELLYNRPTALAVEARQAILRGEVELEVLTRAGMEALMRRLRPGRPVDRLHDALYLPASKRRNGKPYIAVLQLDPRMSREDKIARAPFLAACVVHEYEHHLQGDTFDLRQRSQRLKAEMRAWFEENLYLLMQGEKTVWEEADLVSPDGFATYLRSHIERNYLHDTSRYLQ